ncbi:MAG: RNA-binding protein [Thermoplasmata archaeon]|nr:MAG: RNA-binding protein [Thermoplasmata archaeon]
MEKDRIVLPGDRLSTSEELLPGEGTFDDNGVIRSSRIGRYAVDRRRKTAEVKPLTSTPVILKKGDIVIAEITSLKPSMVIAQVLHVIGKNREISGDKIGTIHISEISSSYVEDPSTEYRLGDIIRARIIQVKPSLQLTTKDKTLGAIKALCIKCRHPLIRKSSFLECKKCGNKEKRKIALDYGRIDLNKI